MNKTMFLALAVVSMLAIAVEAHAIPAAAACDSLAAVALKNVAITTAQRVAAGEFQPSSGRAITGPLSYKNLAAFCRVTATVTPSPDSEIKIEVWLPETGWNGKLQGVGNVGWAGSISTSALATALDAGYAAAATDTGHSGVNPATFTIGHPEKVIDFAYRGVHEMTVAAKALIAAYYGSGPRFSYFNGCSTGGRQAITEIQRYPDDFDGVVAGAAAINASHLHGNQAWTSQMTHLDEAGYIPPAKYPVLHTAALGACDTLDGVEDGVIENPQVCRFDPQVLLCSGADKPSCLTAPQVEVARRIYRGVTNVSSGEPLFPGLQPGSESGWASLSGPKPHAMSLEVFRYLVHQDADWDTATFNAVTDIPLAEKRIGPLFDAIDPNIKPFVERGGKLLMYHGWADPNVSPGNSVNYYQNVVSALGAPAAATSVRLFMVPGMGHCSGGDGTDVFDAIGALDQWVEKAKTPDSIPASHLKAGTVDKTRQLCAYPQTSQYKGVGSTIVATNFTCK